ncbi:fructose-6-phosphate aldolase [Liquorilactobacillus capillatus DSM 19910]|uniref:Fructose-6-phosphate aldolase n=1 Tax=Liquorilactobacillus capillatus DSM 19910 TaxID=1423731 RepID=A0A0R1M334_9LACO|nr:fructose-6-phosphate aldolase [Liquorilactobacillus capillatus DSM 19910]
MELLLDTVNLDQIRKYKDIIALSGVTSNPSIVKKEGKINFFKHMRQIRALIGSHASLHVQVVGQTTAAILADAHTILEQIDPHVFIKIPTNPAGLAAIKLLKHEDINVTATAIYSEFQGYLALAADADYLAPYYNRMVNMNINAAEVITHLTAQIQRDHTHAQILAASFHNVQQVNTAFTAGAQVATISPAILETTLRSPRDFLRPLMLLLPIGKAFMALLQR